jgi:hypothetical protein
MRECRQLRVDRQMIQSIIDAVDAQINKSRSPAVNVVLGLPLYVVVSLPLAFIVGAFTIILTGTAGNVAQTNTTPGVVTGALTVVVFCVFAVYGTYTSSKKDNPASD